MYRKSFLALAVITINIATVHADQTEDLNAFALVLSIPIYADHCAIDLSESTIANISTKTAEMQASMGINDAQVADLQAQMNDQFGKADCTEGSSDRTNFDNAIKAYETQ
jgi:peptidoglycan hydrolase CwlO-like protein